MKVYRVRHKPSGEFWKGGAYLLRSAEGKIWTSERNLRAAILAVVNWRDRDTLKGVFADWEVIEYDLVEFSATPISAYVKEEGD